MGWCFSSVAVTVTPLTVSPSELFWFAGAVTTGSVLLSTSQVKLAVPEAPVVSVALTVTE